MVENRGAASVPPYGPAIHDAIASSDLARMKETARQAQAWLDRYGDLSAALEVLKGEIARREKSGP